MDYGDISEYKIEQKIKFLRVQNMEIQLQIKSIMSALFLMVHVEYGSVRNVVGKT